MAGNENDTMYLLGTVLDHAGEEIVANANIVIDLDNIQDTIKQHYAANVSGLCAPSLVKIGLKFGSGNAECSLAAVAKSIQDGQLTSRYVYDVPGAGFVRYQVQVKEP